MLSDFSILQIAKATSWTGQHATGGKIACKQFFHVEILYVAQHIQNTTTITLALGNTMNHGSRRRTMAAIVPHPWLRGIKHVANILCNNTM
jgi:hypothetical protein